MESGALEVGEHKLEVESDTTAAVYRKIGWRLLPFIFLIYIMNQLDRINISFAKLQFMQDIHLSEAAYGLGAGLFFIGYLLFEVPSNLYLHSAGAKLTFLRIMVLWGAVSAGMCLVRTPMELYVARFLLGAAEAGFFPGVILYLTYWFPARRRARITSVFVMAISAAGIVGGPLSGLIMHTFAGILGLKGWQWLFIAEGLPVIVLGVVTYFFLDNGPAQAKWLSTDEKAIVVRELEAEQQLKGGHTPKELTRALSDPKVYVAGFVYFSVLCGTNAIALWMPSLIKAQGLSNVVQIGWLSCIPYIAALAGTYLFGRSSDRMMERRWHTAAAISLTAICFTLLSLGHGLPYITVALLGLAAAGIYGAVVTFWTIPPAYLQGSAAAGGIALISSLGALGGFSSPTILGAVMSRTGSLYIGFVVLGVILLAGAMLVVLAIPKTMLREPEAS
ncbi:MFS transporter [Paraburkholderia sp. DGU8]|uniref:MFS transporter n=1 Tax=Paraburkholderia sp. DGU8 TaxID=3161997 RepID=UPI003467CA24